MPSDAEVIRRSLHDPECFGELFERHALAVHAFLARRAGADLADDLLGDLFRIAFERRASFDLERPDARPWLYGIASNLLVRHRSKVVRRLRALPALHGPAGDATAAVDERVDSASALGAVARAVAELPPGERDALLLVAWEGLSYQEVADALGVPVGTVRSRLNRARARLRELVRRPREEHGDNRSPDVPMRSRWNG